LRGTDDPWFIRLAGLAIAGLVVAAVIVAVTYTVLFLHFERFMLRSTAISPPWSEMNRTRPSAQVTSAFRAVHRFTVLTLRRSRLHQTVLVGLTACGIGIAVSRLIEANLAGWLGSGAPPAPSLANAAIWTPFGLMFVCGLAVRAALVLPLEHRANWIFRITEDEATRGEQLRAVEKVVATYVVGLPAAAAIPLLWIAIGPKALIGAAVVALVGFTFVHAVLLDWRRIPFTCSYLPGKRFVVNSAVLASMAFVFFPLTGVGLVRAATALRGRRWLLRSCYPLSPTC
jgi:hypothetical protein